MYLEIHGARGSMPVGTEAFGRYGGDTTCYTVHHDDGDLVAIIDAGTGLRHLTDLFSTRDRAPVLMTHYHWDHIQGLSMCAPMWRGDISLEVFGPGDPRAAISGAIAPPWFPVQIIDTPTEFHSIPDSLVLAGATVTPFPIHHPQGAVGYRFDLDGQSLVVATDHEGGSALDDVLIEMARGAGVLVHDAQYLPEEIDAHVGWGHSTWEQAAEAAIKADVGRLVLASHDPGRTDVEMDRLLKQTRERFSNSWAATTGERHRSG